MYLHSRMRGFLPAAIALLLCVSGCVDDAPNNKEVSAQEVSQISAPADGTMSGLKDEKSWSEPDFSALWCGKVWFKVVGGQL